MNTGIFENTDFPFLFLCFLILCTRAVLKKYLCPHVNAKSEMLANQESVSLGGKN